MKDQKNRKRKKSLRLSVFVGILLFMELFHMKQAEAAAGYADLSAMKNGHEVAMGYEIDGDYKFVPMVTDETEIIFSGEWDNIYCRNAEADVNYISRYYPYADTEGWTNTKSAVLTNDKKGKLYVDLKNVGAYAGETINMRVTLTDWTNFTNLPSEDYANAYITMGGDTRLPQINMICVQNLSVKFSYYNDAGQPVSLKGHYTLNDLDYYQGFKILSPGGDVYYTKEAAARMGYDASTETIWADSSGTEPNQPDGWVTYTFEGSETSLQFFVDVTNPVSPDYPYRKWDVSRWAGLPDEVKGYLHRFYKGASGTHVSEETFTAWVTSEFGYTSEAVVTFSKKGNVIVEKLDSQTKEALEGAAFTCYEWTGSGWNSVGDLQWDSAEKDYRLFGLVYSSDNQGRFKIKERYSPSGYTGTWEKEFVLTESGTVTLKYQAENTRVKGQITIKKTDSETGNAVNGVVFRITAKEDIQTAGGTTIVKGGTVVDTLTVKDGSAVSGELELGTYVIQEITPASGYVLNGEKQEAVVSDGNRQVSVTFKNTRNSITIQKVSKDDGTALPGVVFRVWNKEESGDDAQEYITDQEGKIILRGMAPGTYCCREVKSLDGYLTDDTIREFTIQNDGTVDGKAAVTLTVENDYLRLSLAKTDASTGEPVSGAKLALYNSSDDKIESWISGREPHLITKLNPGVYRLVEEQAPNGYQLAEPVVFTLEEKAGVQTVVMKDLRYTDLKIVKKICADEITWAHGTPVFFFTVEGEDLFGVNHRYQRMVKFTEDYVTAHRDDEGMVELSVTLSRIPMGNAYQIIEQEVLRYGLVQVTGTKNVTVEKLSEPEEGKKPSEIFQVTADLEQQPSGTTVTFENMKYRWDDYSHNNAVVNLIPVT